jgi:lipid-A-disaccharide synthase
MNDSWRDFLYYPLGLLPALFFSLRFIIQWLRSEKQKQSIVEPIFWKLSLAGNILSLTHYFIQIQYPFALAQSSNAVIAWRNLNLMQNKKKPISFKLTMALMGTTLGLLTTAFIFQGVFFRGHLEWMKIPTTMWNSFSVTQVHFKWHALGFIGQSLFASRFWIQWLQCEKSQVSQLPKLFWWISIIGTFVSLIYFVHIGDIVSTVNYGFGLIPYVRNLLLIRSSKIESQS